MDRTCLLEATTYRRLCCLDCVGMIHSCHPSFLQSEKLVGFILPLAPVLAQVAKLRLPALQRLFASGGKSTGGSSCSGPHCRNSVAHAHDFSALANDFSADAGELLPCALIRLDLANYCLALCKRLIAPANDLLASIGAFLMTSGSFRQLEGSLRQMSEAAAMCQQPFGKWKIVAGKYPGTGQPAKLILACANKPLPPASKCLGSNKMMPVTLKPRFLSKNPLNCYVRNFSLKESISMVTK